jgi:DNA-binding CsgD family transcriptional regulator
MKMTANKAIVIIKAELKVLDLVAKGFTSELIGKKLEITKSTVQTHRRNMLRKTGFNNTQQLVGWAVKEKLVKYIGKISINHLKR